MESHDGDVIFVIGSSGTGKSTLLRRINQREKPMSGRILVDDVEITDKKCGVNKARQKMYMVFRDFNLVGHLTVIEKLMPALNDSYEITDEIPYKSNRRGAVIMPEREHAGVFRKKTIDRIASPEQLTDYLRVTNPGIWVVLAAAIALLAGILAWSTVGTLETTTRVAVIAEDHMARVVPAQAEALSAGMPLRVAGQESALVSADADEYGRPYGTAEVSLPDGTYEGVVVTESVRPIRFLLTGR